MLPRSVAAARLSWTHARVAPVKERKVGDRGDRDVVPHLNVRGRDRRLVPPVDPLRPPC